MGSPGTPMRSILMLEHDDDDRYITQATFDENKYPVKLHFVINSNDLFAFLIASERDMRTFPSLILLNHYATPVNAVEILKDLKANARFASIPVVVLSGTLNKEILLRCYAAGANSVIRKPSSAKEVNAKIGAFMRYWFETAELP